MMLGSAYAAYYYFYFYRTMKVKAIFAVQNPIGA